MDASAIRLVVLGKTGVGKSSLANTFFGETVFETDASANAGTIQCKAATRVVNGRRITWTDTPGFFDTKRSEEEMRQEILRCIVECAPGPHVFLIVLKVEKFTEQEQAVIRKLQEYFSDGAFKYAIVLFTHGDQLEGEEKIKKWAQQNPDLRNLLKTCGNRCHVFDNKYWKNTQDLYKNNQVQVDELLKTVDELIEANDGGWFTNEILQACDRRIEEEYNIMSSANMKFSANMESSAYKKFSANMESSACKKFSANMDFSTNMELRGQAKGRVLELLIKGMTSVGAGTVLALFLSKHNKTAAGVAVALTTFIHLLRRE